MRRIMLLWILILGAFWMTGGQPPQAAGNEPIWNMNATAIEACSCPLFCQCYFNAQPAEHNGHHGGESSHFCRFNNAYKIHKGLYGTVKLDGAKFWASGDLGGDWSKGQMDWVVVTFDKATTKEQRDAIGQILAHLFPVKWNKMTVDEGDISWTGGKDQAKATIDGGKTAEVVLKKFRGMTEMPVVIKNLKYWGAQRNDGFILMPNVVEAYRKGEKTYEFKGTNGFMLTFDIDSKTPPPTAG